MDLETRQRTIESKHHGSGLAQWVTVLAPLAAAFGHQQATYELVQKACRENRELLLHLPAVISLAIVIGVALLSSRALAARRATSSDARSSDSRARFMATLAILIALFSTALIAVQWLPTFYIHPCQR